MKTQNFALLGTGRTGSNYLCGMLNRVESVVCHKEIFNPKKCYHNYLNDNLLHSVEERDQNPTLYLQKLEQLTLEKAPETKVMGYKVFFNHRTACWDYLFENDEIKKIIIKRDNLLAHYSSSKIANSYGKYALKSEEERKDIKSEFEFNEFESYVREIESGFEFLYKSLDSSEFIELEYNDIFNDNLGHLFEFIGVTPPASFGAKTIRQAPEKMSDRFENFDKVCSELKGTRFESWLEL